ncbi:hypothetical protein BH11PSE6_BH11PSE6_13750 [soil metagenome]
MTGPPDGDSDPARPAPSFEEDRKRFDEISSEFARDSAEVSDTVLDLLTDDAIRQLRLQEATFWQRVKYRSRMLRASAMGARRKP